MRVRQEIRQLDDRQRVRFLDALLELKKCGDYDQLVMLHDDAMMHLTPWKEEPPAMSIRNAAHRGPAFLPWHRQMLLMLEEKLLAIDKRIALPYWDWTIDAPLADPSTSVIFSEDYFGGDGDITEGWEVKTGRFAFRKGNWKIVGDVAGKRLRRSFGQLTPDLPTSGDVAVAMSQAAYDMAPWGREVSNGGFRNYLEGWVRQSGEHRFRDNGTQLHNRVHVWVGGSMLPGTSPNDPLFFMHHCFCDRIWADWQREQRKVHPEYATQYYPHEDGPQGHRLHDAMYPWIDECVTPDSMLDYQALGYQYDNEPSSDEDPSEAAESDVDKSAAKADAAYMG